MKKRDIENMLRNSADSFTPNVLAKVMNANIKPDRSYEKDDRKIITSKRAGWKQAVLAFSCMIVVALGAYFLLGYMRQDYETVYLDVNPSVEIVTNRYGNVKEITYINSDAEEIFAGYDAKGKTLEEVVTVFVDLCYENGYIDSEVLDNTIVISATSNSTEGAEKTLAKLTAAAEKQLRKRAVNATIVTQEISKEEKEENKKLAEEENISLGKLKLINKIIALDNSYTIETLKEKNMKELQAILKTLEEAENNASDDNNTTGDSETIQQGNGNNGNEEKGNKQQNKNDDEMESV